MAHRFSHKIRAFLSPILMPIARAGRRWQGTLFSLIALYRSSIEFTSLSEKTRKSYGHYLRLIEDDFGDMPIDALEHPKARGEFKGWRDRLSSQPRHADYAWTVLARVLSVAKDRAKISINVCERGGRLYEADRAEKIWTADHIKAFCAVASTELQASAACFVDRAARATCCDCLGPTMTASTYGCVRAREKGG
jgi:hypothetical protein